MSLWRSDVEKVATNLIVHAATQLRSTEDETVTGQLSKQHRPIGLSIERSVRPSNGKSCIYKAITKFDLIASTRRQLRLHHVTVIDSDNTLASDSEYFDRNVRRAWANPKKTRRDRFPYFCQECIM